MQKHNYNLRMRKTISLLLLVLIPFHLTAQIPLPTNILSPEAASLGKYGDMPVSYHTGSPSISIPLHTLKAKGLELPITLNYDASGVKVYDHPSWVGQNWNLSAGGAITRSVQGSPDECPHWFQEDLASTFYPYFESTGKVKTLVNKSLGEIIDQMNSLNGVWDMEPDIFNFNFMGITGKFFMGNDGQWKVHSDHNIQVICDVATDLEYPFIQSQKRPGESGSYKYYPKTLYGFKIKDDQGNTYTFGYNYSAIEYSIDFYRQLYRTDDMEPDIWCANAWYLTKVTDKYDNMLYNITYERGKFTASFYYHYGITRLDTSFSINFTTINNGYTRTSYGLGGRLIAPVYLKQIKDEINHERLEFISEDSKEKIYPTLPLEGTEGLTRDLHLERYGGSINWFEYLYPREETKEQLRKYIDEIDTNGVPNPMKGLRWRKLNQIYIYSDVGIENLNDHIEGHTTGNDKLTKVVWFEKRDEANKRLRLDKLRIYDNHPYVINNYTFKFDYYNFDGLTTNYICNEYDHWGYYNGRKYDREESFEEEKYYASREPNYSYLKNGTLSSITYPTGGVSFFEYEPHSYSLVVADDGQSLLNQVGQTSGLRIKKIINNDGTQEQIRTFDYNNPNGESSGILATKPKYTWDRWQPYGTPSVILGPFFSSTSLISLSNSFGSHIGYSRVTEKIEGNGQTIYEYTNYDTEKDKTPVKTFTTSTIISPYDKLSSMGHRRGKLKSKKTYNKNSILIQENIYSYRTDNPEEAVFQYGFNFETVGGLGSGQNAYCKGSLYKIFYSTHDVVSEEMVDYTSKGEVRQSTTYDKVDSTLLINNQEVETRILKSKTTTDSHSGTISEYYYYPFNLSNEDYMQVLTDAFRIGEPIVTRKERNQTAIGYQKTTYKKEGNLYVPGITLTSHRGISELLPEITYDKYDARNGNLLMYTTKGNTKTAILWGYKNSKPVAVAEDILNYNEFISPVLSDTAYLSRNLLNTNNINTITDKIRTRLTKSMVKTYAYIPFGIVAETDARGTTLHYRYDRFGRLNSILDNNNKIVSNYSYNYAETPPLMAYFTNDNNTVKVGDELNFEVHPHGGSGNYTIQWTLANHGGNDCTIYDQAVDSTHFSTHAYSTFQLLTCIVTDNITGETKSFSKTKSATQNKCYFFDVQNKGNNNAVGSINIPVPDTLVIRVQNLTTLGTSILTINDRQYEAGNYSSFTVEVPCSGFNNEIDFSFITTIPNQSSSSAYMIIESLKNKSVAIDTSRNTVSIPFR